MKDVTTIFETYRDAQGIANTYFSTRDNEDWDIIEVSKLLPPSYSDVSSLLNWQGTTLRWLRTGNTKHN